MSSIFTVDASVIERQFLKRGLDMTAERREDIHSILQTFFDKVREVALASTAEAEKTGTDKFFPNGIEHISLAIEVPRVATVKFQIAAKGATSDLLNVIEVGDEDALLTLGSGEPSDS